MMTHSIIGMIEGGDFLKEICNMLLAWTVDQFSRDTSASPEHWQQLSPEVYDRAVSIIGLVVPIGLYLLVLASLFMFMFCFIRLIGGKK